MSHRLQVDFASAEGERDYVGRIAALIERGELDAAEPLLRADLEALGTALAQLCLSPKMADVSITGWEELIDAIAQFEGNPVTAIAIGMANETDLAFSPSGLYDPYLTLGIYTDERYGFSAATADSILFECAKDDPAWTGAEEDIEAYLELEGLAELNTALLRHKTQFLFRETDNGPIAEAPIGYVEFTLAGWWRALLFHRAVRVALDAHGLPGDIPVLAGIANMRQEVASVHYSTRRLSATSAHVAELKLKPRMKRLDAIVDLTGATIRQRVAEETAANDAAPEDAPRRSGIFSRIFGRG